MTSFRTPSPFSLILRQNQKNAPHPHTLLPPPNSQQSNHVCQIANGQPRALPGARLIDLANLTGIT